MPAEWQETSSVLVGPVVEVGIDEANYGGEDEDEDVEASKETHEAG